MTSSGCSNLKPWSAVGIGYIVLFLVGAMLALPTTVFAAAQEKIHDIRVVVDISGSMKKSDPNNVRIPATELLVNLFPNGSRAGVWVFGQQVDRLIPLDTVDDQWKQKALRNTKKISSTSLRTNIGEALLKASVGWEKPDKRSVRGIILLTDGKVDVSADAKMNQSARERLLNSILPQLRARAININTIALSADADSELMEKLAVATDGKFSTINSANDLLKTFVNAFDKVVPLDQVPLKGNRFAIDKSINEFTALIFTHEKAAATVLQTPSGSKYDKDQHDASVQWFHADNYDLITVSKPEAGQWLLLGESDESNRVTVVSDLKLQVDPLPVNILSGERVAIEIGLLEHDKLLDKKAFLDVLSIQVSQQHIGGQQWSAPLGGSSQKGMTEPGKFEARFGKTLVPGEHEFTIKVDGKTFQRQNVQKIRVLDNPFVLSWSALAETKDSFSFTVSDDKQVLDPEKTALSLHLTNAESSTQEIKLASIGKNQWQGQATGIPSQQQYSYTLKVSGFSASNRALDYETPQQTLVFDSNAKLPEPKVDEVAQKPAEPPATQGLFAEMSTAMLVAWLVGINLVLFLLGVGIYLLVRKLGKKKQVVDEDEPMATAPVSTEKAVPAAVLASSAVTTPVAAVEPTVETGKKPTHGRDEIPEEEIESNLHDVDAIESQTDETDLKNIQLDDSILQDEANAEEEGQAQPSVDQDKAAQNDQNKTKENHDKTPATETKKPAPEDEIELDEDFDLDIDELLEK